MALTALGVTLADVVGPLQAYPPGMRAIPDAAIPIGVSACVILIDLRNVTTLTLLLSWTIQYSIDNGATWISIGGAGIDLTKSGYTLVSGILTNTDGGPVRVSGSMRLLPHTELSRLLRITFINNETASVGVTLAVW